MSGGAQAVGKINRLGCFMEITGQVLFAYFFSFWQPFEFWCFFFFLGFSPTVQLLIQLFLLGIVDMFLLFVLSISCRSRLAWSYPERRRYVDMHNKSGVRYMKYCMTIFALYSNIYFRIRLVYKFIIEDRGFNWNDSNLRAE